MKEKKDTETVKITNQFRAKRGMVYDLKCEGERLTVGICPRENDDEAGDWRVDARNSSTPEALVVSEWGATRVDALREVGRAWASKAEQHGLPTYDWEAVAKALLTVRAI